MKIFKKNRVGVEKTEIEQFKIKFPRDQERSYVLKADSQGRILEIKTDDPDIIKWLKSKGFNE